MIYAELQLVVPQTTMHCLDSAILFAQNALQFSQDTFLQHSLFLLHLLLCHHPSSIHLPERAAAEALTTASSCWTMFATTATCVVGG